LKPAEAKLTVPFGIIQWWITRSTLCGALLAAFVLSAAMTARTCDAQAQRGELADIGVTPADITYLALSHSHFDHVGNANDYAGSTWLTQKAERDFMFAPGADKTYFPLYDALARAHQVTFQGDHDVFGDGTVILKFTPGHTPGHHGNSGLAGYDRAVPEGEERTAVDRSQHGVLQERHQVTRLVRLRPEGRTHA
jgi:ribonuclease BN (tRNA processing enzyme)